MLNQASRKMYEPLNFQYKLFNSLYKLFYFAFLELLLGYSYGRDKRNRITLKVVDYVFRFLNFERLGCA
jgi:hypothetical protein